MEYTTVDEENSIEENVEFILNHLTDPLFPRKIMTEALGHQKEVFNKRELLTYFKASNYEDCRINAYPGYTEYKGINLTAPSFIMIDLDLKDFGHVRKELDKTLHKTLEKINNAFHGARPTVIWTGNGYHIYQPVCGFVLEEIDRFAKFIDSNKKDLTTRFMQFAEGYFTDNRGDLRHRPSIKSCLIRVPGTINSKCNQNVKIIQSWNKIKPQINYVLREFRIWLISEIIEDKRKEKLYLKRPKRTKNSVYNQGYAANSIAWIEKLLQTPIEDNRKYCLWRILAPYLVNVKKLTDKEASQIIREWLEKCNLVKRVSFDVPSRIRYDIQSVRKRGYYPIGWEQLKEENTDLFNLLRGT